MSKKQAQCSEHLENSTVQRPYRKKIDCQPLAITIPKDIENLMLPDPELLSYYKNLDDRVIWLDTEVDYSVIELERMILKWNREDKGIQIGERKPIKMFIFSPGGDLDINNSFISLIKLSKTPVWSINVGVAASAAAYISMACHRRLALPGSQYLLHQGSADNISGTFEQVVSCVSDYQTKIEDLFKYIIANSNITEEVLEENFGGEWYISAEEAVELGICDKVITDLDEIL